MIQPRYILFKLKYDLTAFGGGSKNDDSSKDKSMSKPRGNDSSSISVFGNSESSEENFFLQNKRNKIFQASISSLFKLFKHDLLQYFITTAFAYSKMNIYSIH